MSCIQLWFR